MERGWASKIVEIKFEGVVEGVVEDKQRALDD